MKRIDSILHSLVQKGNTPSLHYLLFDQEQIIHQYREGFADVAKQKLTDDNTFYNAFSATKTFTALSVLQLVEKKKVDLDNSAASYLDNFPYSEEITVRQLLSHTAGIPNPNPLPWIHPAKDHSEFDRDDFFS
jgi:D-alanyl-D-alanine carboxypeptidase